MAQPPKKPSDKNSAPKPRFGVDSSKATKSPKDVKDQKSAKQVADSLNRAVSEEEGDMAIMKGKYKKGGKVKSCKMKCGGKVKKK